MADPVTGYPDVTDVSAALADMKVPLPLTVSIQDEINDVVTRAQRLTKQTFGNNVTATYTYDGPRGSTLNLLTQGQNLPLLTLTAVTIVDPTGQVAPAPLQLSFILTEPANDPRKTSLRALPQAFNSVVIASDYRPAGVFPYGPQCIQVSGVWGDSVCPRDLWEAIRDRVCRKYVQRYIVSLGVVQTTADVGGASITLYGKPFPDWLDWEDRQWRNTLMGYRRPRIG